MTTEIGALFTAGYKGAGTYLYINGEKEAFSALTAALARAKETIQTTRYSPFDIGTRQKDFAHMIKTRILGDGKYLPVERFYRIIAVNDMSKLEDIKEYIERFIGKRFILF